MIYFNSDYTEGAHPLIIKALNETNLMQTPGYGEDEFCLKAAELIKKACNKSDIDVHFMVGGTQVNLTVISAALRPHQGVIAPFTGHINVHESGAIEATGHKVIALEAESDGKLSPKKIEECFLAHINDETHEHMVQPAMVYISDSTENGAVYTKSELSKISIICKKYGLLLYLDGARLGYALESSVNDLTLNDLCNYCDAFYIGGTKVGALFGEAVIITNPYLRRDFRYLMKQKGGMLAKGRLLGIQFMTLFQDDLYFRISKNAVDAAMLIARELKTAGVEFLSPPESNQIFIILKDEQIDELNKKYCTAFWQRQEDGCSAIRICTSWATTTENVESLVEDILKIIGKRRLK